MASSVNGSSSVAGAVVGAVASAAASAAKPAVAATTKVVQVAVKTIFSYHRSAVTWLGQGMHRSITTWWNQGGHRTIWEWISGVQSRNH